MRLGDRQRRTPPVAVDLTPLIDVVFLLLIFFMVSSTFRDRQELAVELPRASSGEVTENPGIVVQITADGHYSVDGTPVPGDTDALAAALRAAVDAHGNAEQPPRVEINADRNAAHGAVIRLMDAARRAGLVSLGFVAASGDEDAH